MDMRRRERPVAYYACHMACHLGSGTDDRRDVRLRSSEGHRHRFQEPFMAYQVREKKSASTDSESHQRSMENCAKSSCAVGYGSLKPSHVDWLVVRFSDRRGVKGRGKPTRANPRALIRPLGRIEGEKPTNPGEISALARVTASPILTTFNSHLQGSARAGVADARLRAGASW